jgi:hypothetical protein
MEDKLMKRLLFLSVFMMLGASLAFISGCDDDEATNSTEKAVGNTLDPVYIAVGEGLGFIGDITFWNIGQLLETTFFILYDTSAPAASKGYFEIEGLESASDSIIRTYHSSSQYWYFYVSLIDTAGDSITAEDSIQFLHGAVPVQWPIPAELTGIKAGASFSIYSLQADTFLFNQNFTILGDLPDTGDVVINGNGQVSVARNLESDSLGFCHGSFTMTQTITNVEINLANVDEEDACPTAGTVRYSGVAELECIGDASFSFSDSWTVTQTFSGDVMTVIAENSTTKWTATYPCGGGTTAAPWNRYARIVKNLD